MKAFLLLLLNVLFKIYGFTLLLLFSFLVQSCGTGYFTNINDYLANENTSSEESGEQSGSDSIIFPYSPDFEPTAFTNEFQIQFPSDQKQQRQAAAAFDSANKFYFVVTGNDKISGAVINRSGIQIKSGFSINEISIWRQTPNVTYAENANVFLVTWYGAMADNTNRVYGRLIAFSSNGEPNFKSPEFLIGNSHGRMTLPVGVAYVPSRKEFVVSWQGYVNGATGIHIQKVSASGQLIGSNKTIAFDGNWVDEPGIAYNSDLDEFVVLYTYADNSGNCNACAEVRLLRLNNTGDLISGPHTIAKNSQTWLSQIHYNPDLKKYLAVWSEGLFRYSFLNPDGSLTASPADLIQNLGGYNGLHFDYNTKSKSYLFVMHSPVSTENLAFEMQNDETKSKLLIVIQEAGFGNFDPRVATSNNDMDWLIMTSNDYNKITARIIKSGNF